MIKFFLKNYTHKDNLMSNTETEIIEEQNITFDDLYKQFNGKIIEIPTSRLIYFALYIFNGLKQTDYSEESANDFLNLLGEIISERHNSFDSKQNCIYFSVDDSNDDINLNFCDDVPINLERKCIKHTSYDFKQNIQKLCEGYNDINSIIDTFNDEQCIGSSVIDIGKIINIIKELEYNEYFNIFINMLYNDYKYIESVSVSVSVPISIPNITIPNYIQEQEQKSESESDHYNIYCNGATQKGSCKNKIPKSNKYYTIDGYKSCSIHNGKNSIHSSKLPIINSTNTIKSSPTSSNTLSPSTTCGANTAAGTPCKKKCSKDPSCVDSNGIRRCSMHATVQSIPNSILISNSNPNPNHLISDKSKCHGKTAKKIQCSLSSKIGLTTIDGYPSCTKHSGKESIY